MRHLDDVTSADTGRRRIETICECKVTLRQSQTLPAPSRQLCSAERVSASPAVSCGQGRRSLGYVREPGYDDPDGAFTIDPEGKAPAIGWLRVPEGKSAKNGLHIDIRVAGEGPWDMARRERLIRAKVPRVVVRGATVVREDYDEGVLDHVVMLDPEGNEFCLA